MKDMDVDDYQVILPIFQVLSLGTVSAFCRDKEQCEFPPLESSLKFIFILAAVYCSESVLEIISMHSS